MSKILIYGANGYTGKLIVEEAINAKLDVTLAGRNGHAIEEMASELELPFAIFDLADTTKLHEVLNQHEIVIHCAGPFIHTAKAMAAACIATQTHYLDITGEYQVFEMLHTLDEEAKQTNIMLLPGAGFDVVPSDCLAGYLKQQLPTAKSLTLAFTSKGGSLSRGTAKTMVENAHEGHWYRKNGQLTTKKLGQVSKIIPYGDFEQLSVGISWGDISTAYFSTGIENIEVLTGTTKKQLNELKWMGRLSFLLSTSFVKKLLKKQIEKKPPGPSEKKRAGSKMHLWGKVEDGTKHVEAQLSTPNGYTLTAKTAILIASNILNGQFKAGYQTPAMAYGHDLILKVEGTALK